MCEIKSHYKRKKECPAKFSNETYEQLLTRLKNNDHDYPLHMPGHSNIENLDSLIRAGSNGQSQDTPPNKISRIHTKAMIENFTLPFNIGDVVQLSDTDIKQVVDIFNYTQSSESLEFTNAIKAAISRVDQINANKPTSLASLLFIHKQMLILVLQ